MLRSVFDTGGVLRHSAHTVMLRLMKCGGFSLLRTKLGQTEGEGGWRCLCAGEAVIWIGSILVTVWFLVNKAKYCPKLDRQTTNPNFLDAPQKNEKGLTFLRVRSFCFSSQTRRSVPKKQSRSGPDCMLCQSFWHFHLHVSWRVPLCAIGLAPAGHRVADARASSRVHVLDHDEGMLLQGGHCQVTVIRHLLQEAAVPRPDRVTHLQDPSSKRAHLQSQTRPRCYLMFAVVGWSCFHSTLSSFVG